MEIIGKFRGERDDSRKFVDFTVMEVFRGDLDCRVEKEGNSKGLRRENSNVSIN